LRGTPPQQVVRGTGLVVRAGQSGPSEGLLPYDSTGTLVVDVEIAGRLLQPFRRVVYELSAHTVNGN